MNPRTRVSSSGSRGVRARRGLLAGLVLVSTMVVAGCGEKRVDRPNRNANFECRDRQVAYIVDNGFAGLQLGIAVDCAEYGPRITKWNIVDENTRRDGWDPLDKGEFDAFWERIDSTGWRNLDHCDTPRAENDEPAYSFVIEEGGVRKTLFCASTPLPFPYDRLVNELDLLAAEHGI